MSVLPDVILHFDFLTNDSPEWSIKGENNCKNDYSDYCSREEAFQNKELKIAKYDYYDYTGNEEKTDGIFDIDNDILTPDQEEKYRQLEIQSKRNSCVKYLGYMSFHNNFLEDNKIITDGILDSQKLKKIVRSAMSEMINTSKKLDVENTYWTAAIHINTDNVHAHITLLEKEKRERKNDCIEQYAIEAFKSKVVNTIVGSERSKLITEITRNVLLPGLKNELNKIDFNKLITQLPERQELWFYNRREFKPYKKYIDECVNNIIESTPTLKEEFEGFNQQLDIISESYKKNYGEGEQKLYKEYKKNKLQDFYSRAGNSVLNALKDYVNNPCVLSEKEIEIFEEMELSEIIQTKIDTIENSKKLYSVEFESLSQQAEKENPLAQYTLGKMYLTGEIIDEDKIKATKYLTASAEQNNQYAQLTLGKFFLSNKHFNKDKGIYWMKRAADQDNQYAQYYLGKMYLAGELIPQNKKKAIEYLTASAVQNNEYAQYALGKFFLSDSENLNTDKGIYWLTKSADQDNQYAQYYLGKFLLKDKRNTELGKSYLRKAAEQGNDNAQKYLDRLGSIKSRRRYLQEQQKQKSFLYDYTLQKIVHQLEGHIEKLKSEFNYEEDLKLAQEQHELEMQIEYERSW